MKKLFRTCLLSAATLLLAGMTGCSDSDTEDPVPPQQEKPEIAIGNVTATTSSVTFTLTPKNATSYTYAVALRGQQGTLVEVRSSEASTPEVTGLEADREYTITAIAYNDSFISSEEATYDFVTNPEAQIAIGQVTATYCSATFTLTPTNATSIAYRCYADSAQKPDWTVIESTTRETIEIADLSAETAYTIEAYASNSFGDGQTVTRTFTTEPEPLPLTIRATTTSTAVWVEFTMFEGSIGGYYYYLHDPSSEWDSVNSLEVFLQDVVESPYFYQLQTASTAIVQGGLTSGQEFKLFTVQVDTDENIIAATAAEMTLTTKTFDELRRSTASVGIGNINPGYISAEVTLTPSDDCVMMIVESIQKSQLAGSTIQAYVNLNLSSFMPKAVAGLENPYTLNNLTAETDYYFISIGIDAEGNYGGLLYEEFSSTPVTYLDNVRANVEVVEVGYTNATINVAFDGCTNLRYMAVSDQQFNDWYQSNEDMVWELLFMPFTNELYQGQSQLMWLAYNSGYRLFTLPVDADGKFGKREIITFQTAKYTATGTASASLELLEIDNSTGWTVARFRVTPGAGCASFIWQGIDEEIYNLNSYQIGDYIFQNSGYTTVESSEETIIEVSMWSDDNYYLLVVPRDADGNWSNVIVSEPFSTGSGGGGGGTPVEDPNEVDASEISATAVQEVRFISWLFDATSYLIEWNDYDYSIYRAEVTLEEGYGAWYLLMSTNAYDWMMTNIPNEEYSTKAQYIQNNGGTRILQSRTIAARGGTYDDCRMVIMPETLEGKHSSDRMYVSEVYRWEDLPRDVTDPGITVDPR